jgi:hypothetical protein
LELPRRASVGHISEDIQVLTNLQLRGDLVGFKGKTQNEKNDHDLESSLHKGNKPGYDPWVCTTTKFNSAAFVKVS